MSKVKFQMQGVRASSVQYCDLGTVCLPKTIFHIIMMIKASKVRIYSRFTQLRLQFE